MSRIIVTGAAGFMGSWLAKHLHTMDHIVLAIDDLSGGYLENLPEYIDFIYHDVRVDLDQIFKLFKPDYVYHLAADATEGRSQFTPYSAVTRNLVTTTNIVTACINHDVKRLVYTSSMAAYGDQELPLNEEMDTKPEDVYGTAKAASENIIKIMGKVHGLDWTILRPHNVYGPGQNMQDPYRNVIAIFLHRLLRGEDLYIYGEGTQKRAFSYIEDITPALVRAAFTAAASKEIINLGSGEVTTINDLAALCIKLFNSSVGTNHIPIRPQEVIEAYCTTEKSERILGYKTNHTLEEGLAKMITWIRNRGPREWKYLDNLEITKNCPVTWKERLI